MTPVLTLLERELQGLASKASYEERRQAYSQQMSEAIARALAEAARERGMTGALPFRNERGSSSGSERRMAGGIGAKKVDVTWATEECGLIFSVSIKTINWRDSRSGNFQKNLTNRRGDLLFEAVTLHRRFPYAVHIGFLFLDAEAAKDSTERRDSTFANAHRRLKLFTGRDDPGDRDEQFEHLCVVLVDARPEACSVECYAVGKVSEPVTLDAVFGDAVQLIAERNPDFYEARNGRIEPL